MRMLGFFFPFPLPIRSAVLCIYPHRLSSPRVTYRQASAPEFSQIPYPSNHDDAYGLADFHPGRHDATTNGVFLTIWLFQDNNGARFSKVGPVRSGGDVWPG
jgi:hypothetical protein